MRSLSCESRANQITFRWKNNHKHKGNAAWNWYHSGTCFKTLWVDLYYQNKEIYKWQTWERGQMERCSLIPCSSCSWQWRMDGWLRTCGSEWERASVRRSCVTEVGGRSRGSLPCSLISLICASEQFSNFINGNQRFAWQGCRRRERTPRSLPNKCVVEDWKTIFSWRSSIIICAEFRLYPIFTLL